MRLRAVIAAYDTFVAILAAIVGVLLIVAVLLVTADVVGRYFFERPIGWVFELTEHILMSVPYLGMAWLVRRPGGHVRVEIVVQMLRPRPQGVANVAAAALAGLTCGFSTYWAVHTTWDHLERGIVTYGIYPMPKFVLIGVVALGLGLTTIEFFRKGYEEYRAIPRHASAAGS